MAETQKPTVGTVSRGQKQPPHAKAPVMSSPQPKAAPQGKQR